MTSSRILINYQSLQKKTNVLTISLKNVWSIFRTLRHANNFLIQTCIITHKIIEELLLQSMTNLYHHDLNDCS